MSIINSSYVASWAPTVGGFDPLGLTGGTGFPALGQLQSMTRSVLDMTGGQTGLLSTGFGSNSGLSPNLGGFLGSSTLVASLESFVPAGSAVAAGNPLPIFSGGQGAKAVEWAQTQLGVTEGDNPDIVSGYSNGAWQAWCADFVSKAYENSGGSPFGHESGVKAILDWGKENDRFISAEDAAKDPGSMQVGDVVIWKQDGKSHTGLLTGVNDDGTFTTIEGNTTKTITDPNEEVQYDRVNTRTHAFDEDGLTGFVRPTDAPEGEGGESDRPPSSLRSSSSTDKVDSAAEKRADKASGKNSSVQSSTRQSSSSQGSSSTSSSSSSAKSESKTSNSNSDKSSSKN